ncbi:MAG: DedA family protein [Paludibacteraceae bacterium]|nr:DedA family protein [Paludibacteraceae bacterium]
MNYGTVAALMAVESSFVPFPSEIVVPPAAYVASKPESDMTIWGVVLAATIGALLGALINYFLALWLGRPIIYRLVDTRLGRLLLLSSEKVQHAEDYFVKHGAVSTLVGRLIPAVRQLISIPAGLSKMRLGTFILFTSLGAAVWNSVLALLGYLAQGQSELIHRYSHELSIILLAAVGIVAVVLIAKKLMKR